MTLLTGLSSSAKSSPLPSLPFSIVAPSAEVCVTWNVAIVTVLCSGPPACEAERAVAGFFLGLGDGYNRHRELFAVASAQ